MMPVDRRRVYPDIPAEVICPDCERKVKTMRGKYEQHSTFVTGPLCIQSGQLVSAQAVADTAHVHRMNLVLDWAQHLHCEDPRRVQGWVKLLERGELELMLLTALAGIDPEATLESAFGWVRDCAGR
jgi:hypothetical protein